jgi:hypothetical protein
MTRRSTSSQCLQSQTRGNPQEVAVEFGGRNTVRSAQAGGRNLE